jgi:hypothetical protein
VKSGPPETRTTGKDEAEEKLHEAVERSSEGRAGAILCRRPNLFKNHTRMLSSRR